MSDMVFEITYNWIVNSIVSSGKQHPSNLCITGTLCVREIYQWPLDDSKEVFKKPDNSKSNKSNSAIYLITKMLLLHDILIHKMCQMNNSVNIQYVQNEI